MSGSEVLERVGSLAACWRSERAERLRRRHLVEADFRALADTGYLVLPVPVGQGGHWEHATVSLRPVVDTFSRSSPFASWFEDVRALGFLRPPWGLAYDSVAGLTLG